MFRCLCVVQAYKNTSQCFAMSGMYGRMFSINKVSGFRNELMSKVE